MRRFLLVSACLGVLALTGTSTALARGPHHGHGPPAARYGFPQQHGNWNSGYRGNWNSGYGGNWNSGYRGNFGPQCGARPYAAAYSGYSAYPAPIYGSYPQLGFGVGGRNFSFWFQQ